MIFDCTIHFGRYEITAQLIKAPSGDDFIIKVRNDGEID